MVLNLKATQNSIVDRFSNSWLIVRRATYDSLKEFPTQTFLTPIKFLKRLVATKDSNILYLILFLTLIAPFFIFSTSYIKDLRVCDVDINNYPVLRELRYADLVKYAKRNEPILKKDFWCPNIMRRMAWRNTYADEGTIPPMLPPADLLSSFTMNGRMPVTRTRYINNKMPQGKARNLTESIIERLQHDYESGRKIGTYGRNLTRSLDILIERLVQSDNYHATHGFNRGFVIGSQSFWVEMLLLKNGIKSVTTLEYSPVNSTHPQINALFPSQLAQVILSLPQNVRGDIDPIYDIGVSYSSLEHSGLGRYGDRLDPSGDLEAMAQAWCLTQPGGYFLLDVPFTESLKGFIEWNAHRVYSIERIAHMAANWVILPPFPVTHIAKMVGATFVFYKPIIEENF